MSLASQISALATRIAQEVKLRGVPSGGTDGQVLTKSGTTAYATVWATASGGSGTTPSPAGWQMSGIKCANVVDPGALPNQQAQLFAGRFVWKMYTPVPITVTQAFLPFSNVGSNPAGFYVALYDSTGTLFPGSGSAEFASTITNNGSFTVNFGATTTIPMGFFYVVMKTTSASTWPQMLQANAQYPNTLNTGTNPANPATAVRWATGTNDWSGATPPTTIGTLGGDFRSYVAGVR